MRKLEAFGEIKPHHLNGMAALAAAENTKMCKKKGEKDTEFVKRIVCAYLNAHRYYEPGELLTCR